MRVHSDTLTTQDIRTAAANLGCGVYANVTEHGSRSHAKAFEVRLEGNGYARNTGTYGAGSTETGATWDDDITPSGRCPWESDHTPA